MPKATPCRRCRSTEFRAVPQTFKDGSTHLRQECAGCGKFKRYLQRGEGENFFTQRKSPPVVPAPARKSGYPNFGTTVPDRKRESADIGTSQDGDLSAAVARAREALSWLDERVRDARRLLDDDALDLPLVATITAAVGTAAVLLDPARLAEKAEGRQGRVAL
jgi:hypothetical protein